MARYVILTLPTHGSIHPTVAVAHELVARGHDVLYYLPRRFAATVADTGALVRVYDVPLDPVRDSFRADGYEELVDRIGAESADCLVYDSTYILARIVRKALGLAAIVLHHACVENEHTPRYPIVDRQRAEREPVPARLNIVFLPREYQPAGDTFDGRYVFVGPSIRLRPDDGAFPMERLDTDRPVIYVALGSMFKDHPGLLVACAEAFGERQWRVVVSAGTTTIGLDPAKCPDNVVVTPFAPQLEVLSRAAVFVTGCGMTSVMEGLYYGVPMLGVPRTAEQELTARRIAELGMGLCVDRQTVTASSLYQGVARILAEPALGDGARQMQRCARAAGGYRRAADEMIRFCRQPVVGR